MTLPTIGLPQVGLPIVTLQGVSWMSAEVRHEHDYIGNWLWDDGSCILWDDGAVMAL